MHRRLTSVLISKTLKEFEVATSTVSAYDDKSRKSPLTGKLICGLGLLMADNGVGMRMLTVICGLSLSEHLD